VSEHRANLLERCTGNSKWNYRRGDGRNISVYSTCDFNRKT